MKVSPFGTRATITIVVLGLAFWAMVIAAVSGQALSPARHLAALLRYHRGAKRLQPPHRPDKHGLVLDRAPGPGSDITERAEAGFDLQGGWLS